MRPDRTVMAPPAFDDDLSFSEGIEDLAVEQPIAQARVEALDVAVLPRTAAVDPSLDGIGDELRPIIRPGIALVGERKAGERPQDRQNRIRRRGAVACRQEYLPHHDVSAAGGEFPCASSANFKSRAALVRLKDERRYCIFC